MTMEGNTKWMMMMLSFAAAITLTLMSFHAHDENKDVNFLRTGDLKETALKNEIGYTTIASVWVKNLPTFNGFWGGKKLPNNSEINSGNNHEGIDLDRRVLSPNISSCHDSHAVPDGPIINCCPATPLSEEDAIDFGLPPPSSLRVRRPAHLLDDEYIAKYKKAMAIMKTLPDTDPRKFMRQALLHCIYCTGSFDQKYSNSILFFIHRNWYFFPWHRMYLYFHEKILGSLIGDENFALPFWQWDSPDGTSFPRMYMEGSLVDEQRNPSHLSPQSMADLTYRFTEWESGREELISSNLALMYHTMVSGGATYELFLGCPFKVGEGGECYDLGTMEAAPHDTVHGWVGKLSNVYHEDMGAFYSAGKDPSFFAHHANIDRLWEVWRELGNHKKDVVDPEWLNSYFYFYDEKSQLVRVRVHQILNITDMGYRYQQVDLPWLNAKPKPSISPKIARNKLKMNMKNYSTDGADQEMNNVLQLVTEKSSCFEPKGRTLNTNVKVRVYRPRKNRSKKEMEEVEEILVVYGIDVETDVYAKFDVYVNLVFDGSEKGSNINLGPQFREYAGTYINLPDGFRTITNEGGTTIKRRKSNLKLGISELLRDLEADEDDSILVTLVPKSDSGKNTTVGGVRIDYLPRYTQ